MKIVTQNAVSCCLPCCFYTGVYLCLFAALHPLCVVFRLQLPLASAYASAWEAPASTDPKLAKQKARLDPTHHEPLVTNKTKVRGRIRGHGVLCKLCGPLGHHEDASEGLEWLCYEAGSEPCIYKVTMCGA